jgi:hypothetical protein
VSCSGCAGMLGAFNLAPIGKAKRNVGNFHNFVSNSNAVAARACQYAADTRDTPRQTLR